VFDGFVVHFFVDLVIVVLPQEFVYFGESLLELVCILFSGVFTDVVVEVVDLDLEYVFVESTGFEHHFGIDAPVVEPQEHFLAALVGLVGVLDDVEEDRYDQPLVPSHQVQFFQHQRLLLAFTVPAALETSLILIQVLVAQSA